MIKKRPQHMPSVATPSSTAKRVSAPQVQWNKLEANSPAGKTILIHCSHATIEGAGFHTHVLASGTALLPAAALGDGDVCCTASALDLTSSSAGLFLFLSQHLSSISHPVTRRKLNEHLPHSLFLVAHSQNAEENPNGCTVLISTPQPEDSCT